MAEPAFGYVPRVAAHDPVDRTGRGDPAAAVRAQPATGRRRARRRARACRRAPCTGSCGRCSGRVRRAGRRSRASTSSAPRCCTWARSYLDGNELRTRALNWSDSLAARSGESVRIGTLHEGQVLVVHHVFRPGRQPPGARGRRAAAGARDRDGQGAAGREPLRRRRADRSRAWPRSPPRRSPTRDGARARSSTRVRERGWAADVEELVRRRGLASPRPIQDRRGVTVGAIGISGPVERLRRRRRAAHRPGLLRARGRARGLARPRRASRGEERHRERALHRRRSTRARRRRAASSSTGSAPDRLGQPDRAPAVSSRAPGWVEHDAAEIWRNVQRVVADALAAGGAERRRPRRARASPTSARRRCCGTARPACRCTTRSTGRTRAPTTSCASWRRRRGPTASATAAGCRSPPTSPARRSAGCSTTSTGCASAPRPATCCSGRWTRG